MVNLLRNSHRINYSAGKITKSQSLTNGARIGRDRIWIESSAFIENPLGSKYCMGFVDGTNQGKVVPIVGERHEKYVEVLRAIMHQR
jgi:hypothetical protein